MSGSEAPTPRFTSQAATAEDLLKSQTVGLVQLDEFRKRRRDVEELRQKEGQESDGALTPRSDSGAAATSSGGFKKKKRKIAGKGLLSFGGDDEEDISSGASTPLLKNKKPSASPMPGNGDEDGMVESVKRKLTSNPNAGLPAPKAMTKASLAAEAAERERLRKEFLEVQERVRNTEVAIPFVFYDGSNLPGGMVRVKKGDHIWLFLERCRKVGAELGVGGRGEATGVPSKPDGRKSWARIGVDDLMCVRGEIIIPHHYELYYFIANKVKDPKNPDRVLFNYSGTAPPKVAAEEETALLRRPRDEKVEGHDDEPSFTKVVDRRWYERNKHIYPAILWKEYKPGKEFEEQAKGSKDAQGNSYFYS